MANETQDKPTTDDALTVRPAADVQATEADDTAEASQMGSTRYVLAGFLGAAIVAAYVLGHMVTGIWNKLAESQWAVDKAPFLAAMVEDGRSTWGMVVGGVLAAGLAIYFYRRDDVRTWVTDAASELAKVTWPTKKEVTSATVVVVIASAIATVYLALLDRFWGFVTDLVYRV